MKKILILMIIAVLALSMVACNNNENDGSVENETNENQNTAVEETEDTVVEEDVVEEETVVESRTLEEIIDATYAATGLELPKFMKAPLNAENMVYMLGVDNFEYLEGLTSEPMMSSIAHSIVLFTVADDADIEGIKADIKANVDGRKWICVNVEDENIRVENVGNHIILIMDNDSQVYLDAFYSVMEQ